MIMPSRVPHTAKYSALTLGAIGVVVAACIGLGVDTGVKAASLSFTLLATHPQAAAQPTASGKIIQKLVPFNGKLYAGYGDYTANTGPIAINAFNPSTSSFGGVLLNSPTEAIFNMRIINGKLYAPDTDPIAGESSGGYAIGEPWSHKGPVTALHVYDVATLTGSDLWMVGSKGRSAVAWRSLDGGTTWAEVMTETPSGTSDYARYYWTAVIGGKIYMQAETYTNWTTLGVKSFDGSSWTTGAATRISFDKPLPQVFNGKIITDLYRLSAFDGTTVTTVSSGAVKDMAVADGYLYVLRAGGAVQRTSNLSTFEALGSGPTDAASIAVLGSYVYLGGSEGRIYRSSSMAPTPTPTPTPTPAPTPNPTPTPTPAPQPSSPGTTQPKPSTSAPSASGGSATASPTPAETVQPGAGTAVPVEGDVEVAVPTAVKQSKSPMVRAEYRLDGKLVKTITSQPFEYKIDTGRLENGPRTLQVSYFFKDGSSKTVDQVLEVKNELAWHASSASGWALLALVGMVWAVYGTARLVGMRHYR